jgi:hypothetical protein
VAIGGERIKPERGQCVRHHAASGYVELLRVLLLFFGVWGFSWLHRLGVGKKMSDIS